MARILLSNGCSYSVPNVFPKNWKTISASTKKAWYITYRYHDPAFKDKFPAGKLIMVKGMNDYADLRQRQASTRQTLDDIKESLEVEGYNPISELIGVEKNQQPSLRTAPIMPEDGFWRGVIFARTTRNYSTETNTHLDVDSCLRQIMKAALALNLHTKPLKDFRRRDMLSILDSLSCSPNGYNKCLKYLKPLFDILITYEALELNPAEKIPKKVETQTMRKVLTPAQRIAVDNHLKKCDRRFWLFVNIFFHSGTRAIELLRLRREDLCLETQTFTVEVRKGKHGTVRREERPVKNIAVPFWEEYILENVSGDFLFSKGFVPGAKSVSRDWVTHYWEKLVKSDKGLGIDIDLYSLKHLNYDETTAIAGMETAAKQAGHTSLQMGKKHYAVGEKTR